MPRRCPLVVGNWKMNGTSESLAELGAIASGLRLDVGRRIDVLVCLPATLLSRAAEKLQCTDLSLGGEDCHTEDSGAYTGDVSATMLKDAGANYVIAGHSERRISHHETDEMVRAKANAAWRAGLTVIICVGETLQQREDGKTLDVISHQCLCSVRDNIDIRRLVIAYEPIWAIGTGKTPAIDDIAEAHTFLRRSLYSFFGMRGDDVRLLYGGSVKPGSSVVSLLDACVDGVLVGGASLKAADFLEICDVYRELR